MVDGQSMFDTECLVTVRALHRHEQLRLAALVLA